MVERHRRATGDLDADVLQVIARHDRRHDGSFAEFCTDRVHERVGVDLERLHLGTIHDDSRARIDDALGESRFEAILADVTEPQLRAEAIHQDVVGLLHQKSSRRREL